MFLQRFNEIYSRFKKHYVLDKDKHVISIRINDEGIALFHGNQSVDQKN